MDKQIAYQFDKTTLIKIGKGALIAGGGAAGLYLLGWLGELDYGAAYTPIVAAIIPILINAVKEWMKGEKTPNQ